MYTYVYTYICAVHTVFTENQFPNNHLFITGYYIKASNNFSWFEIVWASEGGSKPYNKCPLFNRTVIP